ncbi:hypothetical protein EI011_24605, partial [Escherichia coli]|nr:hypothetical protein [Escherichia coli]
MKTLLFLSCIVVAAYCACNDNLESVLDKYRNREIDSEAAELDGDDLIDYVNENQNLWTAKKQRRFSSVYGENDKAKWGLMGVNHVRLSVKGKQHLSKT